jgi:hypothetical protein
MTRVSHPYLLPIALTLIALGGVALLNYVQRCENLCLFDDPIQASGAALALISLGLMLLFFSRNSPANSGRASKDKKASLDD